jgi:hypothetical protein
MGLPEIVVSMRGGVKIMLPIFFSQKYKYSYFEMYVYDGYIMY